MTFEVEGTIKYKCVKVGCSPGLVDIVKDEIILNGNTYKIDTGLTIIKISFGIRTAVNWSRSWSDITTGSLRAIAYLDAVMYRYSLPGSGIKYDGLSGSFEIPYVREILDSVGIELTCDAAEFE